MAARRYFRLGVPTVIGCVLAWALIHTGLVQNLAASDITRSSWLRDVAETDGSIRGVALATSRLLVTFDKKLGSNYNTSLWTMPVEISASLAILLGVTLARRAGEGGLRTLGIVSGFLAAAWIGSYCSLFAFGIMLRLAPPRRVLRHIATRRWVFWGLCMIALFCLSVPYSATRWPIYQTAANFSVHIIWRTRVWVHTAESFWHAIGTMVAILLVQASDRIQALLCRPAGRFLGRISFPLYILNAPILTVVLCGVIVLGHRLGAGALLTTLVAYLLFVATALVAAAAATPMMEDCVIAWAAKVGDRVDRACGACTSASLRLMVRRAEVARLNVSSNSMQRKDE